MHDRALTTPLHKPSHVAARLKFVKALMDEQNYFWERVLRDPKIPTTKIPPTKIPLTKIPPTKIPPSENSTQRKFHPAKIRLG